MTTQLDTANPCEKFRSQCVEPACHSVGPERSSLVHGNDEICVRGVDAQGLASEESVDSTYGRSELGGGGDVFGAIRLEIRQIVVDSARWPSVHMR